MSKEKEIQDELERYWGQMDRIERMLKWLIWNKRIDLKDAFLTEENKKNWPQICDELADLYTKEPDISDILEER